MPRPYLYWLPMTPRRRLARFSLGDKCSERMDADVTGAQLDDGYEHGWLPHGGEAQVRDG